MKAFFNTFLTIISIIILLLIFISTNIKDTVLETINDSYTSKEISYYLMDYVELEFPDLDAKKFIKIEKEINENENLLKITEKYYKALIKDLKKNTKTDVNIEKEINNIIDQALLNNLNMTNAQTKFIKSKTNEGYLTTVYPKLLDGIQKNVTNKKLSLLNIYKFLISKNAIYILSGILTFIFILLIIINNSLLKSFKLYGYTFVITGFVIIFGMYLLNKYLGAYFTNHLVGRTVNINIMPFNLSGILSIIVGVFLFGTYIIFKKEK